MVGWAAEKEAAGWEEVMAVADSEAGWAEEVKAAAVATEEEAGWAGWAAEKEATGWEAEGATAAHHQPQLR